MALSAIFQQFFGVDEALASKCLVEQCSIEAHLVLSPKTQMEGDQVDIKRFIIGTVVGGITLYVLGYIIFVVAFADFYAANAGSATGVQKDPQVMWAVALGTLSYAALVTLAIGMRAGSVTIMDGAKAGAVVGFLLWFTVNMVFFGITNMSNITVAFVDPLLELVRGAISGAVVAVVLGKMTA